MHGIPTRLRFVLTLVVLLALAGALLHSVQRAQADSTGWVTGWNYRKQITIDRTNVDAALTDFPFYVKINQDTDLGAKGQNDGDDIRFASSTGALLKFEQEDYRVRAGSGSGNFWVKVPRISNTENTVIYLYYGNSVATNGQDAANAWDASFKSVWHLSGSTLHALDSTSNKKNGTISNATATTGNVGGAANLNGSNAQINNIAGISLNNASFSLSAWAKRGSTGSFDPIFAQGTNSANVGLHFTFRPADTFTCAFWGNDLDSTVTYTDSGWHFFECTYDASTNARVLYVDGVQQNSDTASADYQGTGNVEIGYSTALTAGLNDAWYSGTLDELRISTSVRSAPWVKFEYNNINQADNEFAWGAETGTVGGWSYRKKITIDRTNVSSALTDFPLLVRINQDTDIGAAAQADGDDIRFTTSTGVVLPFEEEDWRVRAGSGSGNFWVKVPSISSTANTVIYLYYGSASATDGQAATSVWDSNFKGVWHLGEASTDEASVDGLYQDTTANNNDGNQRGNASAVGKIATGQQFDGTNDYISIADSASWDFGTGPFSIAMWFKKTGDARGDIFNKKSSDDTDDFGLLLEDNEEMTAYFKIDSVGTYAVDNGGVFTLNNWHYATFVRDNSGNITTYIDGSPDGSGTSNLNMNNNGADIWLGSNHDNSMVPTLPLNGLIDEVRISNTNRSASWVKFEYYNMDQADNELAWSAQQNASTGLTDTTTVLTTADSTTGFGQSVTLTATVTPSSATGTVTFKNGGTSIGTATLGHGSGSLVITTLAEGVHSLTAVYAGNAECGTSTSSGVTQTVSGINKWPYRKRLTIDRTNVDAVLSNFPLLVSVSQDTDIGAQGQSDGDDIRFATSTGVILPFEEEDYRVRAGSGSGNFWVKVPAVLSASDTTIYLYYGSGAAADGQDAVNVWDSNFKGVWHLDETVTDEATTADAIQDSTGNNNDGTQYNNDDATAKVGKGQEFDKSGDYILVDDDNSLDLTTLTVSFWAYPHTPNSGVQGLVVKGYDAAENFEVLIPGGTPAVFHTPINSTGGRTTHDSATNPSANTWYYITLEYTGTQARFLVDGAEDGNSPWANNAPVPSSQGLYFGTEYRDPDGFRPFDGLLDEIRVSNVARSTAWVKFEYYNMNQSDNEIAWSTQQDVATGIFNSRVTLTSSDTSTSYSDSITLTATVTPSAATGTVTFKKGGVSIGTATLGHGSGSLTVTTLPVGSLSLTAEYGGNHAYATSSSSTLTQIVSKAASTVSLASSDTLIAAGDTVILTATVTPSTATGTLTFKDALVSIGTVTLSHGSGAISTTTLTAGTHILTAEYGGNQNYLTSTSASLSQTVTAAPSEDAQTGGGGGGGGQRRGSTTQMGTKIQHAHAVIELKFTTLQRKTARNAPDTSSAPAIVRSPGNSGGGSGSIVQHQGSSSSTKIVRNRNRLIANVDNQDILYRDVPLNAWFTPYVSYVIEEQIAQGYRDGTGKPKGEFGVEQPITYAEVLKMALEAANVDLKGAPPSRNLSVRDSWAAPYVATAEALQLSVFRPDLDVNQPATRGAVIQTILEVLKIPVAKQQPSFTDVPQDHPFAHAIATAAFYGFVEGDKGPDGNPLNRFRPDDPINRAEVAKIIALAVEVMN